MRKQFDLNYYLEHPETKVVTRSGLSARIICTDAKSEGKKSYPVVGLVFFGDKEVVNTFTSDGLIVDSIDHNHDLFFELPDPEKKRVPLTSEDLLQRVKEGKTMWIRTIEHVPVICQITAFLESENYLSCDSLKWSTEDLMKEDVHFVDGTPCWKEVDCE